MKVTASSAAFSSCSSSSVSWLLMMLLISIFSTITTNAKANDDQDQEHMKPPWIKSVISVTETAFPYTSMYLEKGKVALKKVHGYLFRPTPDVDFRSSPTEGVRGAAGDGDVISASKAEDGGGGVGERVKEAASKSLEKSKSTLEESAKLACDALHEVTDKLKSRFKKTQESPRQHEL